MAALRTVNFKFPSEMLLRYDSAKTVDQLVAPYTAYLRQFGLMNMLISGLPMSDVRKWQHSIVDNHWQKDWYARYLAKGHYRFDPCVQRCRLAEEPFLWSEISAGGLGPHQRLVLNEAADFGMRDGLCIPIHRPMGPPAVITLSGERVDLGHEERIAAGVLSRSLFSNLCRLTSTLSVRETQLLTAREIEVVQLTADGKSASEAATTLYISKHTVERHLLNIRTKMECNNTTEAVAKALRMHQIH